MRRCRKSSKRGGKPQNFYLSTSSEEDIGVKTRSSMGKRQVNKDSKANGWEDSVYDADEDTGTSDLISPQKMSDPYEFDFTGDIPVTTKNKTKKQSVKTHSRKKSKKSASNRSGKKTKSNATSTPVLTGQVSENPQSKSSNTEKELLVTPEVTPILPVQTSNKKKESSEDSYSTPTVRRSLRKRSLHLGHSDLSLKNSSKSFSSQADSGIVVSPPLKKIKPPDSLQSDLFLKDNVSAVSQKVPDRNSALRKDTKKHDIVSDLNKQKKRKVLGQKTDNRAFKRYKTDESCFGFVSSAFSSLSDENVSVKKGEKNSTSSKNSYRCQKKASCSSSLDSPFKDSSVSVDQENVQKVRKSPILFSDDTSSDDGSDYVSKPSKPKCKTFKSYTALKAKTQRSQQLLSKLDSLADEYNSQFADIEKFELVIE